MPVTRFDIVAQSDPQILIRLLNQFAQLGLRPSRVTASASGDLLNVRIEQGDLSEQRARIIAERMRASILVVAVHARHARRPLLAGAGDDLSPP